MSGDRHDVAIAGGGAVGTALALALARGGLEVALIEPQEPAPWNAAGPHDLRTYALSPASVALLSRLDVWSDVRARRASAYNRMCVWENDPALALAFGAELIGESQLGWIVEDAVLRDALWQRARAEPRVAILAGAASDFEAGAAGARLATGDSRALRVRLAVAADGGASPLRALAGLAVEDHAYGQRAVVANVRTQLPHQATAWQRFTPEGTLAFLPLANGESSIVWSLPDARARDVLALDDAAFRVQVGESFQQRLGEVVGSSARASFPLRMQLAPRYVAPRVALVGDAAHVVHPLAGQGLNLGLLDVAALADVLAQAREQGEDLGNAAVLARYEAWRRADVAAGARAFDAIDRLFRNPVAGVSWLRRTGLALVDRIAPLKREFALHASGFAGRVPALSRRLD